MKNILLTILVHLSIYTISSSLDMQVNYGTNILPNGMFSENEWADASSISDDSSLALYFKQDSNYIYIGIEFLDTMHTGIDLYLAESASYQKMLHVSSALGEKTFKNGGWSDYDWGGNDFWIANSIGMIYVDGRNKTLPLEGFEFQINKTMFKATEWFMMIHLKRPELYCPWDVSVDSINSWIKLTLQ